MLKGNLAGFSLGELFQSLAINHHTGTLTITGPGGGRKLVYFENGEIRLFSHGKSAAPRIGEMLVARGALTPTQLESALRTQKDNGAMLGQVLLSEGYVSKQDIVESLHQKILEELYDLFLWSEGDFEFAIDHCPEELFDSLQRSIGLVINPNAVIMEGLRRLDEWGLIGEHVRSGDEVFCQTEVAPSRKDSTTVEVYELVDGRSTASELSDRFHGTRFDVWKAFHTLAVEGAIRPLNTEEVEAEIAEARSSKDSARETSLLRFATQLDPEDAKTWLDLGLAFEKLFQESEAHRAWMRSLRIYASSDDLQSAAVVAGKLPANADLEIEDLEALVDVFVRLRDSKKSLWAGNLLAQKLQELGEHDRALEVLDSLIDLDPQDLNLRIQIAGLTQKHGNSARAIEYYEEVAAELEKQKKIKDQLKILRLILEIDPKRTDLRQRVAMLTVLLERIEKRRKRSVTLAGCLLILLFVGTVVPLVYEIKARELHSHAKRMEQISLNSREFTKAREAYELLIQRYPLSLQVTEASLALERIAKVEQGYLSEQRENQQIIERRKLEARRAKEQELDQALTEARKLEAAGQLAEAHVAYRKVMESLDDSSAKKVLFPVLIESSPPGATVFIAEEAIGTAPLIHRYVPGSEVKFRFVLRGCEERERADVLFDQHSLKVELTRKTSWEQVLASTFRQSLVGVDEFFVFPSRDGHVYAFDPSTRAVTWKRKVGRFGDRVSDLHVRDRRLFLTTVLGEIAALDAHSGDPLWITPALRGPATSAPVSSEDGRFVAVGSLRGDVVLLRADDGEIVARFSTENEIVAAPIFVGDTLVVGSTDSHVYGFSTSRFDLSFVKELSDEVVVAPVRHESLAILATADSWLWALDAETAQIEWKASLEGREAHTLVAVGDGTLLVALDDGEVLSVYPAEKRVGEPWRLGDEGRLGGIAIRDRRLFATHQNGVVASWDLESRKQRWRWQADASVQIPALVVDDQLFVASTSGAVQVLEILR